MPPIDTRYHRRVRIGRRIYPSVNAAAEASGITAAGMIHRINSKSSEFATTYYVETRIRYKVGNKSYRSTGEIAEAHGISRRTVRNRMADERWPDWVATAPKTV